jgi:hypothetical protein
MPGLAIPPHSPRITNYAIAGLMLISAASFAAGLGRVVAGRSTVTAYPTPQAASARDIAAAAIPEATAASETPLVPAQPAPHRRALPAYAPALADDGVSAAASASAGADVAAAAPEAPAAAAPENPAPGLEDPR